jgi:hypothetical protein
MKNHQLHHMSLLTKTCQETTPPSQEKKTKLIKQNEMEEK